MVQRTAAGHIFQDFSHSTCASVFVTRLELQQLETRRRVDKVSMMYKGVNNLVDIAFTPGTLQPSNSSTRGRQLKLQVPPEAQTAASLNAFKSKLGGWAESVS